MKVGFALKIEVKVEDGTGNFIDQLPVQTNIHLPFFPRKLVHPAGTFRAMQVAAVGRFDGKADRFSPLINPVKDPGKDIPC